MTIQFEVSTIIRTTVERLYTAWLDSSSHTDMTGGKAVVSKAAGGEFTAWDGYITGRNLELSPPDRIVQSWRTAEFTDSEPDSRLEVHFEQLDEGTRITIRHSNLPEHGMQYKQGWVESYFEPMKEFFEK